jgi:hypothetical protein
MGKRPTKYNKKDGVEFKMMFRHHKDPLYYDTKANAKIFVPVDQDLTEEQRKIVESFPAEDRGLILEHSEYRKKGYGLDEFAPGQGDSLNIELDEFEAAAKRHQLKEEAMRQKQLRKKQGLLIKENENPYDSDEREYREAHEAEEEY